MDIFIPIALIIIAFIIFSLCGWCCKKHRQGTVYGYGGTPVTVNSQPVNQSPVVVPPYPTDPRHPTPATGPIQAPPAGFAPPPGSYQSGGYPPATAPGFYCPPPAAGVNLGAPYPGGAPYPPTSAPYPPTTSPYPPAGAPYPPQTAPPPSYHEAVQPQPPPPTNELYAKQSPYNPNY